MRIPEISELYPSHIVQQEYSFSINSMANILRIVWYSECINHGITK